MLVTVKEYRLPRMENSEIVCSLNVPKVTPQYNKLPLKPPIDHSRFIRVAWVISASHCYLWRNDRGRCMGTDVVQHEHPIEHSKWDRDSASRVGSCKPRCKIARAFSHIQVWNFRSLFRRFFLGQAFLISFPMAKVVYEIDPDADTVVILKNPLKHFAVWDPELSDVEVELEREPGGWGAFGSGKKKSKEDMALSRRKKLSEQVAEDIAKDDGHPETSSTSANSLFGNGTSWTLSTNWDAAEPSSTQPSHTIDDSLAAGPSALSSPMSIEPEEKPLPADEKGVHYHVSSRHLKLASRCFNTMLSGEKWDEGIRKEDGLFCMRLEGWDADAFLILMDIFHLRNRRVPRSVDLDTLAKIAVMVDYYECEEATELFTAMWITDWKKKQSVPTVYGRDLMLWICVARVFDLPEDFERTTSVALRCSTEDIRTLELPIWPTIVRECRVYRDWRSITDLP
jgi:hypothetical protein